MDGQFQVVWSEETSGRNWSRPGKTNRGDRDKAGTGDIPGWENGGNDTKVGAFKRIIWQLLIQVGVIAK